MTPGNVGDLGDPPPGQAAPSVTARRTRGPAGPAPSMTTRRGRGAEGPAPGLALSQALEGPVVAAARALLGAHLTVGAVTVRLTEVEAYSGTGEDPASHAHRGRTPRNTVMFGPAGYAYVYFTYGMYYCVNVVTGTEGTASAVLLRAGEVVDGLAVARARRPAARKDAELARGPARLCAALAIDRDFYGTYLLDGHLTSAPEPVPAAAVSAGPRVGVTGAHDVPWRFWLTGDPTVSDYRRHVPKAQVPAHGSKARGPKTPPPGPPPAPTA